MSKDIKTEINLLHEELAGALHFLTSDYDQSCDDPWNINKDNDFLCTQEILQIVSENELSKLFALYRIFSVKDVLDEPIYNCPYKEINKVLQSLEALEKKGWLPPNYKKIVREGFAYTDKGALNITRYLLNKNVLTGGTPYKDPVLTLIIILLVELVKKKAEAPYCFTLISRFLAEQEITKIKPDTLKKRYERNIDSSAKFKIIIKRTAKILKVFIKLKTRAINFRSPFDGPSNLYLSPIPDLDRILKKILHID